MLNQHPTTFDNVVSDVDYIIGIPLYALEDTLELWLAVDDLALIDASMLADCGIDARELERLLGEPME